MKGLIVPTVSLKHQRFHSYDIFFLNFQQGLEEETNSRWNCQQQSATLQF